MDDIYNEADSLLRRIEGNRRNLNPAWVDGEGDSIEIANIPMDWLTITPDPIRFALSPYFPRGAVTLWIGAGGVGKTYTALYMACCYATGKNFLDCEADGNKVAYLSLEDPETIVRNRLHSLAKGFDHKKLAENMMYIDRYGLETHLVASINGDVRVSFMADEIIAAFGDQKPDMLIVDTLIRTHSVNENSNAEMGVVIKAYERLARYLDCAIVVLHHVPKAAVGENTKGSESHVARGASAITDNARSSVILEHETKVLAGIDAEDIVNRRLIKVTHRKHNYSSRHPDCWLLLKDGAVTEFIPKIDKRTYNEIRYQELFDWWAKEFDRKPICKQNIRDAIEQIRPKGTNYGRNNYVVALDWAEAQGYVSQSHDKERHSHATFYILGRPKSGGGLVGG